MTRMQELIRLPGVSITILATSVWLISQASAQGGGDAEKLLKGMADYVASQQTLSVSYDFDIEVITSNLQKIQFTSSGQVQLSRPDKLRATRTGGYRDVEIVFDGKMLTVSNKDAKDYAQIEATGTAEELIDVLREKHGVVAPGADLLLTNVYVVAWSRYVLLGDGSGWSDHKLGLPGSSPTGVPGRSRARALLGAAGAPPPGKKKKKKKKTGRAARRAWTCSERRAGTRDDWILVIARREGAHPGV